MAGTTRWAESAFPPRSRPTCSAMLPVGRANSAHPARSFGFWCSKVGSLSISSKVGSYGKTRECAAKRILPIRHGGALRQVVRALEVVTPAGKNRPPLPSLAHWTGHSSQRRKIGRKKRLRNPISANKGQVQAGHQAPFSRARRNIIPDNENMDLKCINTIRTLCVACRKELLEIAGEG
jgi:hypothetical protein